MYEGRNQLVDRLTWQVGGDREFALQILRDRGHMMQKSEELTPLGKIRDDMTAAERETDRGERRGSSNRQRKSKAHDAIKKMRM